MPIQVNAGWMSGELTDDHGKAWPIVQHRQPDTGAQHGSPVNLVLHTTETDGYVERLEFPSNFQVGEGKIGQHIQLGFSGDAVYTYDRDCIGVEIVGRSNLQRWLPPESSLGPLVALMAWLHKSTRVHTALGRPYPEYPVVLDKLPAAVTTYYRRKDPRQAKGVYGHVDLSGGNSHWDPGSLDYPLLFARVKRALDPKGDDDVALSDYIDGQTAARAKARESGKLTDPGAPPDGKPDHFKAGWADVRWAARQVLDVPGGSMPSHTHKVEPAP